MGFVTEGSERSERPEGTHDVYGKWVNGSGDNESVCALLEDNLNNLEETEDDSLEHEINMEFYEMFR